MWLSGDLPIHFTNEKGGWGVKKGTIGKMMKVCKSYIESGTALTVFPEGGRTTDGRMMNFKDGFFQLALDTEATILVSACDESYLQCK